MLSQLRVENYAVIDRIAVDFAPGLNLLTGETGAGKSILIGALSLLLGEKTSSELVRHGAERAVVSGVFQLETAAARVAAILERNGIDVEDPEQLIVRREVLASGKARALVNHQPATVAVLKQLAPEIAFLHAQRETLAGFNGDERRHLLDGFAGLDGSRCAEVYARWRQLAAKIAELEQGEQERLRMVDLWSFQRGEIAAAHLEGGEDERLEAERRILQNAEKLHSAATGAYGALYEEDRSAAAAVRTALKHVEELARYEARFAEAEQALRSARAAIEDVSATARDYAEKINASPARLGEIEDRLAALQLLKRKYGQTINAVLAFEADLARKLNEVENRDQVLAELGSQLAAAAREYEQEAERLSAARKIAAKRLEKIVEAQINDLAMKARFSIALSGSAASAWHDHGFDEISYLIATNPGEPLKPVEEIASGGELSRVMLALKAGVFEAAQAGKRKRTAALRTLVFDEIDIGIGGKAAEAVGAKLKQLSRSHQVLCITHLPQIASFADQHFVIEKGESGGRTSTRVRPLAGHERTEEIARMLSGAKVTEASIRNAEQMLKANA